MAIPAAPIASRPVVVVGGAALGPTGPSSGPGPTGPTGPAVSGATFPDAPINTLAYGRKDAAWARVLAITNDVLDGGNY